MDPRANFSEVCETLVVSAHGCAMRAPMKLEAGMTVHFHSQEGRETTAQVVYCQPIKSDRHSWRLGAQFDQPDNFWGLQTCPKDWMKLPSTVDGNSAAMLSSTNILAPSPATASAKIVLDRIKKQLSDEHLKSILAELVRPLESELTDLKETLAQGAKRSRFEVSLSQIPPELEQQLELRLKKELEPQVLRQSREQSEKVLEAAKAAIDQKTTATHDEFLRRVTQDLQMVEQKALGLSTDVAQSMREHLNRGMGELHQQVLDAGNRVKKLSAELLQGMEYSLGELHDTRRRELEQVKATVTAESSRLQEQIADLDGRMAKLDESARRLETVLDKRLSQLSSDTIRSARAQLESALEAVLGELSTRNVQQLQKQLDAAGANLQTIQRDIEAAVSESLKIQVAETLQSFEHRMEGLAQQSAERWRLTLAGTLNSLVRSLGEQFLLQATNGKSSGQHFSLERPSE
ncbi:MAG: hypothetical protein WA372_15675 [Candidatus Sulfotelmatobacter sp.]